MRLIDQQRIRIIHDDDDDNNNNNGIEITNKLQSTRRMSSLWHSLSQLRFLTDLTQNKGCDLDQ